MLASLAVATLLASAGPVLRDPGFDLETWRSEDGLPSDAVIALAQTPDGYLWIGTNAGLARFDGVRFEVFDRRTTPELQSDQCGPLVVDGTGALWIATMGGGLTRYADGRFTAYGRKDGSKYEYTLLMLPDRDGRLWIGTDDRLHLWNGTGFEAFGPEDGLDIVRPLPLFQDAAGRVWLQGLDGRFAFEKDGVFHAADGEGEIVPKDVVRPARPVLTSDGTIWIVRSYPAGLTHWANGRSTAIDVAPTTPIDGVTRIVKLSRGDVWIGMRDSGLRLLRDGAVTRFGAAEGLPSGPVAALLEDLEGNLWVGNSGGLTRIRPRSFASLSEAGGLEVERTWAVYEDRRGDVWFGTDSVLWRLHDGRVLRYGVRDGLPGNGVTAFAEDERGALWIGTIGGLARFSGDRFASFRRSDGLPHDNVRALYTDRAGRLWVGTAGGLAVKAGAGFRSFTTADGLAGDWVRFIHEDASGDLWLATTSGVSRLHAGAFTTLTARDGLADDRVLAIHEDEGGALWFGTYRGGLSRYKDGRFATVARANGLHDDTILRILEDARGDFWMSSPRGVFRVARRELDAVADGRARVVASIAYDKSDGLPTIDCGGGTQPAGWRGRDGRLWFPTGRGIAVVDPASVVDNAVPPPVHIEEVLYDRVHTGGPGRATLPPGSKTLEIHYTATALMRPDRARFRFRLEPFDADWVDAGSRRVAYFTALRPGRYRFHVTAANESGVWNDEGAVYDLEVRPHLYETPAFFAGCAGLTALAGWGLYRLRIRQIEARYAAVLAERGRIARELHDTIAQGFTGVSMQLEAAAAKLSGAPGEIRDHLDRARSLVRTSLHDARRSVRALRPQLLESRDLAAALEAVASELASGTAIRAEVRAHGVRRRLPPAVEDALFRVGQEAMTNAVRHGACRALEVELRVAGGRATLTVADDGAGFVPGDVADGSGIGGMRGRLEALGGTLSVTTGPGQGTCVVAAVPVRPAATGGAT